MIVIYFICYITYTLIINRTDLTGYIEVNIINTIH